MDALASRMQLVSFLLGYIVGRSGRSARMEPYLVPKWFWHNVLLGMCGAATAAGIIAGTLLGHMQGFTAAPWTLSLLGALGTFGVLVDRYYRPRAFHDAARFVEDEIRRRGL